MPPAVWAPVPGVRGSENVVRDSGVLIGVFEPIYLHVSNRLFSDYYCLPIVICGTPLMSDKLLCSSIVPPLAKHSQVFIARQLGDHQSGNKTNKCSVPQRTWTSGNITVSND